MNIQGIPVLYPVLRDYFGFGYTGIAFLSLVSHLVTGPTQIIFGMLTRVVRRFHILGVGTALAFIGTVVMAAAEGFSHLVIGRVIRSLGTSPYHPVGGAIMASSFPNDRAKALGLYQAISHIGSLLAPLLVGVLLHVVQWRWIVFILGIPFLISSFLCFLVKAESVSVGNTAGGKISDRLGFKEYQAVFRDRNTLVLSLTMMVGAGGRGGGVIQAYLTVLLVDRFGISVSHAAFLFSAYVCGNTLGPLAMGWFSDRTSPLLATRLNLVLSSVFLAAILWPTAPGFALIAFVFMAGFFIGSRTSLLQALLIQSGTREARIDTQLSMYFTIGAVSGPVWTLLIGILVDRLGIDVAIWTMATSYILGMAILGLMRFEGDPEPIGMTDSMKE